MSKTVGLIPKPKKGGSRKTEAPKPEQPKTPEK